MKPLIASFIIPVLNGERYIERCLLSIKNQIIKNYIYEVIILDNGSYDETHKIILSLGFKFHIIKGVNVSTLRNYGARQASGQYLAFVDSDVELSGLWLEAALNSFTEKTVLATGCFPRVPPNATWVQATWDVHQSKCQSVTSPSAVSWLPSMNLVVRRHDFLAIGGFNENLETAEDVDLCYRLGSRGTILCNPTMEAIHWGEAQDLQTFWRKEVWRGLGNIKGVLSHGVRWEELPSLGYPLYMLLAGLFCMAALLMDIQERRILLILYGFSVLTLPAMCLAINTSHQAQNLSVLLGLFILYVFYGLARAYSIVKSCLRVSYCRRR